MTQSIGSYSVEEHVQGGTLWVSIRARGSEWSWLTEDEAAAIGRRWAAQYSRQSPRSRGRSVPLND